MIRRFVCLLLVLLMLANQGLCLAHSHHRTDIAVPEGHESRPHIHVGGHSHHESMHAHSRDHHADRSRGHDFDRGPSPADRNDGCESFNCPTPDHDADAVYCTETVTVAQNGRTVTVVSTAYFAASAIFQITHQNDVGLLRPGPLRGRSPSVFDADCPLYLRALSLRI